MRRTLLAIANMVLALLYANVTWLALAFGILGYLSHPASGLLGFLMLLAILAGAAVVGGLAILHFWVARRATKRKDSVRIQRALAIAYLVLCPIGVLWAAPGIWSGATVLALVYVCFFVLGGVYGLYALWVTMPRRL